jgi:hypothetical protein
LNEDELEFSELDRQLRDAATEDIDASDVRLFDHGVRVADHRLPLTVGLDHRCAGK